ncbi:MAG: hypothetical protein U5K76_03065 [Woeseiaceae bacterium]|nr:hypothetical protein [Woeseiaceae bacterium]
MGAAIARALDAAGHPLVAWNRSPERLAPFRAAGIASERGIGRAGQAVPGRLIRITRLCRE